MNSGPASRWHLLREAGLDYADDAAINESTALVCPISAELTAAGELLVVDDGTPDRAPPRMRCRTLMFSADGGVAYDSVAQGMDDAYGCLVSDERIAVLRRDRSELCVLSRSGKPQGAIDLSGISRHRPKVLCWTPRATFLVAFLGGPRELDIAELDLGGRVLWRCNDSLVAVGSPASLQLLPDDSILVADEFHHVVWQLRRDGSTVVRWGDWHAPSASMAGLHRPKWAHCLADGTLLVADADNGRVLVVDQERRAASLRLRDGALFSPTSVRRLGNGNYLICDAGLRCVIEVNLDGQVLPRLGVPTVRRRLLSLPRAVQYLGKQRYLVANTGGNTVVETGAGGVRTLATTSNRELFWPRAARMTPERTLLVADGRNSRVLEFSPSGEEIRQLKQCRYQGRYLTLQDPHDVRLQANRNLLIVDSPQNLVIESNWNGQAAWVVGLDDGVDLRDPHSAQQLPDGRILISDARNDRIVFVDPATGSSTSVTELRDGELRCSLSLPRYAEAAADGSLAIVDSGNNRVLLTDLDFSFLRVLSEIPGSPIPYLRLPRWVQVLSRDELVVSDHGNHRILHVQYAEIP